MGLGLRLAALAAAMALGGCNMVVTDKPLFSAADAGKVPSFRPGIWTGDHPDCAFDESLPQNKWPACANPVAPMNTAPIWLAVEGEPDILQVPLSKVLHVEGPGFIYIGWRPRKLDGHGLVIDADLWPVLCGPPPADQKAALTSQLSPGLQPKSDKANCTTAAKDALRNAARVSEAWTSKKDTSTHSHWVRDPIPGDLPPPSD
jgi:hypothetical protein